jgi:hypothetical protein
VVSPSRPQSPLEDFRAEITRKIRVDSYTKIRVPLDFIPAQTASYFAGSCRMSGSRFISILMNTERLDALSGKSRDYRA